MDKIQSTKEFRKNNIKELYITNDYKFGIAIKGYGLAGTLRWACISNDITNDDMFVTISRYIVQTQNASINRIQSKFKCGFNRAQAIVEKLAELGVVSENMGSRARNVLMDDADLEDILSRL